MRQLVHVESSAPKDLPADRISRMLELMQHHYDGVTRQRFLADLEAKDFVVSVSNDRGVIVGFSTLAVWDEHHGGRKFRIVFSGDTIIEQAYWGSTAFAGEWIRLIARIKSREPDKPLYWLLIVKGHRTYRHLPVFAKDYFPRSDKATPQPIRTLMDHIARERFGDAYCPETGLIRFSEKQGNLKAEWAAVPEKDARRPEVVFFLQRNPRYADGDELVCLTEISADNLKPFARRIFEATLCE